LNNGKKGFCELMLKKLVEENIVSEKIKKLFNEYLSDGIDVVANNTRADERHIAIIKELLLLDISSGELAAKYGFSVGRIGLIRAKYLRHLRVLQRDSYLKAARNSIHEEFKKISKVEDDEIEFIVKLLLSFNVSSYTFPLFTQLCCEENTDEQSHQSSEDNYKFMLSVQCAFERLNIK